MSGEGATMAAIDKAIQGAHRTQATFAEPRQIRVLLVITGLAAGGATNVVLDIAS